MLRNSIIKFSLLLLVGELLSWWMVFYSPIDVPTYFNLMGTSVNVLGLFLFFLLAIVLYFFQKHLLNLNTQSTILQLAFWSATVVFISELIFQFIRLPTIAVDSNSERLYLAFRAVIVIPAIAFVMSLVIASLVKRNERLKSKTNGG